MAREVGWIRSVDGDQAEVLLEGGSHCSRCGARFVCTAGSGVSRTLKIPNNLHARVGDQVEIEYRESSRIFSAFAVFILPIILLIAGYLAGYLWGHSEFAGAAGGLAGIFLGFLLIWGLNRWFGQKKALMPVMVRIVQRGAPQLKGTPDRNGWMSV